MVGGDYLVLELKLVTESEHVDVGLVVVVIIPDDLIAIEGSEGVLLGEFPVDTHIEARLLQAPGIEELDISIGGQGEAFLVELHLESATKHILALAAVGMALPLLIHCIPAIGRLFRAIGVLPALTERELEIAKLLGTRQRNIETMAHAPIVSFILYFSIIQVINLLIIIIKEVIACRGLEPLGDLILGTESTTPAVHGLGVVACTDFGLETQAPLLAEFLLCLERKVETKIV